MTRDEVLKRAKECVCGERERDYGTPVVNFKKISDLWSDYMNVYISPVDAAVMMALFKIARIKTGTGTDDSFVDLAGYAAIGAEVAADERIAGLERYRITGESKAPKEPRIWNGQAVCPTCGRLFGNLGDVWSKQSYCDDCGQKIDWSTGGETDADQEDKGAGHIAEC